MYQKKKLMYTQKKLHEYQIGESHDNDMTWPCAYSISYVVRRGDHN